MAKLEIFVVGVFAGLMLAIAITMVRPTSAPTADINHQSKTEQSR